MLFVCLGSLAALVGSPGPLAAGWTLIEFGTNDASNLTPYPGWTQVLRHPTYTRYVSPDGDPAHTGISPTEGIPEGETAFFGVRGTMPIMFRPGQKIVVTFYNRSDQYVYPAARFSFTDADAPDAAEPDRPWYTLFNLDYEPEGTWVEPHTVFDLSYYVSDSNMVNAINGPPAQGSHFLINVSLPYNDTQLVLTKIDLSDECDRHPPTAPRHLRAESFGVTAGAERNLVRLSWEPSADNPTNSTGISRYFVYRDGALYDLVDPAVTAFLGTNLHYIDLNVAPATSYEYRVSAIDRAPYGLYPQGTRLHSRFGNESPLSAPAVLQTPPWGSARLLNPWTDFCYRGGIRLPWTPAEEWAYAAEGLAYYPSGNPGYDTERELPGSLYGFAYVRSGVAEINIPIPALSDNPAEWPTARTLQPAADLWPAIYGGSTTPAGGTDIKVAALAYHPAANGVAERLYYSVCNYYGTDPSAPSLGWFDLDLTEGHGAWFLDAPPPDNVFPGAISRYLLAAPADWAATHLGGRSLLAGNTILSGGIENYNGPTLFAFAPWESGSLPPSGGVLPTTLLLRYSPIGQVSNRVINWRLDETAEGPAWISCGGKAALAVSYRRTVGDVWYGDSLGNSHSAYDIPEPPFGYKGGSCTEWRNGLMFYNPDDLAAVAQGKKASWEPQPYVVFDTQQFSRRLSAEPPESGAIAFAPGLQTLFYLEHNGDPEMVYGLIHAWKIAPPTQPLLQPGLSNQTCHISWHTAPDSLLYQLEQTDRLAPASWSNAGPGHLGDGSTKTVALTVAPNTSRFYRLRVSP
ncbi:MAG TPA: fibronectin type III domain-containing protein [Candidatus Paceibacterota bacterium]|nr:fibronectin type III domain-containing protein [Candidatus Paceibacterota bacterium]HRZ55326.1 fibronectin type III domain-containing protein [Candidatus Paceibacterota bacterium]